MLTLRDDIRFHDGHQLKAEDVKKSFARALREPAPEIAPAMTAIEGASEYAARTVDDVSGIIIHSENRLEFKLREALSIYPALLTDAHAAIARLALDSVTEQERLYGTGPFESTSQTPTQIVLQRNADYWKGNPPRLDVVEFRPGLNAAKVAAGLRSGEFDVARDLLPQDLNEILRDPRFGAA